MPNEITIQTNIPADIQTVWKLYTSPEHIIHWNFADPSWHCPSASVDLKKGGAYKARMEAKDGSFGFDFEAVIEEVKEPTRLVYILGDNRNVKVDLKETNQSTEVVVCFDAENENPLEMQREGWQSILNQFKTYVELKKTPQS
ncbi:activator of HSP90 ATPase [Leptospira yanagawae]|uniref:Activator of HSP90 ATPase n=1 Tax=Leptospira yanagawae TaxID=293069 RepID=A0ABY2M1U1_9LEPT|nr:SRPBCC domain-containing protein [Leptospira yanagawae]TGL21172.1 activator of HSP90 ATPase [Leptospira yanagawae]